MSVDQHFLEVKHVLLQAARHVLDLDQIMPVVLVKHALYAHRVRALLAKVLYHFVKMSRTVDVVIRVDGLRLVHL